MLPERGNRLERGFVAYEEPRPERCSSEVWGQSGGGGVTLQKFPGLSSSSATVQVVKRVPVPVGSEWTTCAEVVRKLAGMSRRSRVPRLKGRRAWSTQPWLLTSRVCKCPLNVKGEGESRLVTDTGTDNGIRWLRRRSSAASGSGIITTLPQDQEDNVSEAAMQLTCLHRPNDCCHMAW